MYIIYSNILNKKLAIEVSINNSNINHKNTLKSEIPK